MRHAGPDRYRRAVRPRLRWLGWLALFALTFLTCSGAVGGSFLWDDDHYIVDNPNLRDLQARLFWMARAY